MERPKSRPRQQYFVPRPDRIRTMRGTPFGWIDARLWRGGWLEQVSADQLAIYSFLCIVANREGVSWYRRDRLARELGIDDGALHRGLQRLKKLDLISYRPFSQYASDGFHQVLSLPTTPPTPPRNLLVELAKRCADRLDARRSPRHEDQP